MSCQLATSVLSALSSDQIEIATERKATEATKSTDYRYSNQVFRMQRSVLRLKNKTNCYHLIMTAINMISCVCFADMIQTMEAELHLALSKIVGLSALKVQLQRFAMSAAVTDMRQVHNLNTPRKRPIMLFLGNPGTGKTSFAEIVASKFQGSYWYPLPIQRDCREITECITDL